MIIGALYVSTVFVCMALAILSVKTLSALEEERNRFAILYRLGADEKMQKSALLWQTGAFFLMPFAFPLLMTVPMGVIFGKVYEIWNLTGLSGGKATQTLCPCNVTASMWRTALIFCTVHLQRKKSIAATAYRCLIGQMLLHRNTGYVFFRNCWSRRIFPLCKSIWAKEQRTAALTVQEIRSMGKKTITGNITLTPSECSTLKDYAVNGILAKAENSRLEEKLQQAQKSAAVWKQRYELLKEQARPYLEAVKLAPEKVRAFLDAILTRTRQTKQHNQSVRRKSQNMEL